MQRQIGLSRQRLLDLHSRWPERYPALLESASGGPQGRYDILLAFPQAVIRKDAGDTASFLDELDRQQATLSMPPSGSALPFTGGWFVYLSYEMAAEIEPRLRLPFGDSTPVALALRIPAAAIVDHGAQCAYLVAEDDRPDLLDALERDLNAVEASSPASALDTLEFTEDDPQQFLDAVVRAKTYISAGDIYQANLSRLWQTEVPAGTTPADVYRRLRLSNPAPFAGSFVWDDFAILSSSPERLCELRNGEISTRPIAGTRRRSREPGADDVETSTLIAHPKERAEHIMLIDLERNDLGRICTPGSVRVDEFMALESYQHVHHIVSNVRGRLRPGITPGQALRAVFPGGTITGCPKVRCMEIIAELEGAARCAYTGSFGYLNRDGSGDFSILIRTMVLHGRQLSFRAGAGIVADSQPQQELEETRAKAMGLLRAVKD